MDQETVIDLGGAGSGAPVDTVPELREGAALDLPDGAVENADGSVTLTFAEPVTITYRPVGGGTVRSETIDHFVLRRLKGAQVRRIMDASSARASNLTLALSTGISEQKLSLIFKALDAPEMVKARQVTNALLDMSGDGLPDRAVQSADGSITLPLLYAATDGDGEPHEQVVFKRLKAEALIAMQGAKDFLSVALHRASGLSPKAAAGLIDDMDGADVNGCMRVIGFLSGIGRRTGG